MIGKRVCITRLWPLFVKGKTILDRKYIFFGFPLPAGAPSGGFFCGRAQQACACCRVMQPALDEQQRHRWLDRQPKSSDKQRTGPVCCPIHAGGAAAASISPMAILLLSTILVHVSLRLTLQVIHDQENGLTDSFDYKALICLVFEHRLQLFREDPWHDSDANRQPLQHLLSRGEMQQKKPLYFHFYPHFYALNVCGAYTPSSLTLTINPKEVSS